MRIPLFSPRRARIAEVEALGIAIAAEPVTVHPGDKLNVTVDVTNPDDFSVDYRITHLLLEQYVGWRHDWILMGDCEVYNQPWQSIPSGKTLPVTGVGDPHVDYHTFTIPSDIGNVPAEHCKVTVDIEGRKTDDHSVTDSWSWSETGKFEIAAGLSKPDVSIDVST